MSHQKTSMALDAANPTGLAAHESVHLRHEAMAIVLALHSDATTMETHFEVEDHAAARRRGGMILGDARLRQIGSAIVMREELDQIATEQGRGLQ